MRIGYNKKLTREQIIDKFKSKHGDRYDYKLVNYISSKYKVIIGCKEHGYFTMLPRAHYTELQGCPKCGINRRTILQTMDKSQFITKSKLIHGNRFNYDNVDYVNNKTKVRILCSKHGEFEQTPDGHLTGKIGCKRCVIKSSKYESEIFHKISSLGFNVTTCDRTTVKGIELDIYIPEKKLAIEFNGIYWHTEQYGKNRNYHKNKTDKCADKGIRLIHIWEDDYIRSPEIEISFIKHLLHCSEKPRIGARVTILKNLTNNEHVEFLNKYHIQGSVKCSISIGIFYKNELVGVGCFTKRFNEYELVRYACKYNIIGGLGKISKWFSNNINSNIYTFCDLSRFNGMSYEKSGYEIVNVLNPDYKYVINGERKHKFGFRKNRLKKLFPNIYNDDKTEYEIMTEAGIFRIWDCGKIKYRFKSEE